MKIFISHSSKDKEGYCNDVADRLVRKLGNDSVVYDALSFEAGELSIDEINRTLSQSDIYVILLSQFAIESPWVKYELSEAYKKLSEKTLNRIYPLIIDKSLKYDDKGIPEWLRDYNLKYVARPAKAAQLIIQRANDLRWQRHSIFRERDIFVGRNDLVNDFETRIDDFDKPPVNAFIVSGLPSMGRKSLARNCLIKGTITSAYYEFPQVSLSYQESIEDFILKIFDLGFSDGKQPKVDEMEFDEKVECAINLSKDLLQVSEIVLIRDDGCIIDYRGNISEWFKRIISCIDIQSRMLFIIITKYRITYESIRGLSSAFYLCVPELSVTERKGLLRRLAELEQLDLNMVSLDEISRHLSGYPAQVSYAVDIVKNQGYTYLQRNFRLLDDYNEQEVSLLLEKYRDDEDVNCLLALLSKYDAISITMLFDILGGDQKFVDIYYRLFQESFLELEGVSGEYIRVNEVIRNYVTRSGAKILPIHRKRAQEIFRDMFYKEDMTWYNANDYLLAMKENVINGEKIEMSHIIPSVYLKSIMDLYVNMKFDDVVKLAWRALDNTQNNDEKITNEIRYWLCAALAKLKDKKCLDEVQKLDQQNKAFLLAFYYRQIGRNDKALEHLNFLLQYRPDMSKAKREKVQVLCNLQQYEEAMSLAKENYYGNSDNPYHIHAFFNCLINCYGRTPDDEKQLEELLYRLGRIQSEKAQSMHARCMALYTAYVDNDYDEAMRLVNQAVEDYPKDKKYALDVKFDIARLFRDVNSMKEVISELKKDRANSNSVIIDESKLIAIQGNVEEAVAYFDKNISYFTDESKERFCRRLRMHHPN